MKMNKKGFTLIELLAVIIILGLLMAIAIPSVTRYIDQSRRKTLVNTIGNYVSAAVTGMNAGDEYTFQTPGATPTTVTAYSGTTLYAIPVGCINLEKGGANPYGQWQAGSYVLVTYHDDEGYRYGFQFAESQGHYLTATPHAQIKTSSVQTGTNTIAAFTTSTVPTGLATFNGKTGLTTVAVADCTDPWRAN